MCEREREREEREREEREREIESDNSDEECLRNAFTSAGERERERGRKRERDRGRETKRETDHSVRRVAENRFHKHSLPDCLTRSLFDWLMRIVKEGLP